MDRQRTVNSSLGALLAGTYDALKMIASLVVPVPRSPFHRSRTLTFGGMTCRQIQDIFGKETERR
jgi:hypothetical protein